MIHRVMAAVMVAVFCSQAAAGSMATLLAPSPWGLGITIARWIMEDQERVFYVEVTAEGRDLEQARQSAFRMAVERAIGTVISSESQAQGGHLVRDEIITYAGGYVKNYELVETNTMPDRTQVRMKIWVASNKLANRLLNQSQAAGAIEGGKIGQQIESLRHERLSGDRLLLSVLKDYPYRAFDVEVLPTQVTVDRDRNPVLHVFLNLGWNQKYLDSLGTAVSAINQKQNCDRWLPPPDCARARTHIQAGSGQAWMDDDKAWHLFLRETVSSQPQILLTFLDRNGTWLFKQCVGVNELDHQSYASHHYIEVDGGRVLVRHRMRQRVEIPIPIGSYPVVLSSLDRVDARIVRNADCRS